jgi:hypothetical protein
LIDHDGLASGSGAARSIGVRIESPPPAVAASNEAGAPRGESNEAARRAAHRRTRRS